MHVYACFNRIMLVLMSRPDLLLRERHATIKDRLALNGRVIAGELAAEFGLSEDTIRRDLRDLAAAGICQRVYGGALPMPPAAGDWRDRRSQNLVEKQKLAGIAVRHITTGMTVFFDASSANLAIARALPDDLAIIAATNAPQIAAVLADKPNVDLMVIGGQIDRHVGGAVDTMAESAMASIRPDLCILGACGLDIDAGITAVQLNDATFKRRAASQSKAVMISITSDKYHTAAAFPVIDITRKIMCVTLAMPDDLRKAFEQKGATVYST